MTEAEPFEPGEAGEPIGLWIDALCAHAARPDGDAAERPAEGGPLPPAAILPRFRGEPLTADLETPPHPRGCGDIWPPEGRVEPDRHPGRFPVGYAWPMLRGERCWHWAGDQRPARLEPAEAIAAVARARAETCPARGAAALALPPEIEARPRKRLAAALAQRLPGAVLVSADAAAAAALGALAEGGDDPAAPWLYLHVGLDRWTARVVDPAAREAAAAASLADPLPGFGLALLAAMAERSVAVSHRRPRPGAAWQLLWGSPWAGELIDTLAGARRTISAPHAGLAPQACRDAFVRQQARVPVQQATEGWQRGHILYPEALDAPPDQSALTAWLQTARRGLAAASVPAPERAVATGALALLPDEGGVALADRFAERIQPRIRAVRAAGRELPADLLARGAAIAARCG